jgi:hypothetical protein
MYTPSRSLSYGSILEMEAERASSTHPKALHTDILYCQEQYLPPWDPKFSMPTYPEDSYGSSWVGRQRELGTVSDVFHAFAATPDLSTQDLALVRALQSLCAGTSLEALENGHLACNSRVSTMVDARDYDGKSVLRPDESVAMTAHKLFLLLKERVSSHENRYRGWQKD